MPPLEDVEIREKLRLAFQDRTSNGVLWKPVADEWVRKNLGATPRAIGDRIHEHLVKGGKVQQVEETRPGYIHHKFHYDFLIHVRSKLVYVETVLAESKMGPVVTIVNVHYDK